MTDTHRINLPKCHKIEIVIRETTIDQKINGSSFYDVWFA